MAHNAGTPIFGWVPALPYFVAITSRLGRAVLSSIEGFGQFVRFTAAVVRGLAATRVWAKRERLARQLFHVGTMSLPVVGITGAFIGMILAFEGYLQFESIGQESRLGGVINLSLVKQIGPVLAAVMLAGRVGCALAAELGTMRVTEQLDAMRAMASDPIKVLVIPRFVACVAMIPALTVVSNLCGVAGGWYITTRFYSADPTLYLKYSAQFVSWFDILSGMVKAVSYGGAIGLIACFKGFHCKPGAVGVGRATTEAFVVSFMAIIALSLVLAKLLNDVDLMIHGGVDSVFTG